MTTEALRALSEKYRKQTEDGINEMIRANVDPKAELVKLIESFRQYESAQAPTNEPFTLAGSILEIVERPPPKSSAAMRIAG